MSDSVLVLSGLDPCGGAGISADIETINQFGVTALPIVTTLTVQNTQSVKSMQSVDAQLIAEQFTHLQADIDFDVIKIGLLSSVQQIKTIANLIKSETLVLDPIINASTGEALLEAKSLIILKTKLLPLVKVLTPNASELQALTNQQDEQKAVALLPCEWVLVTTTDSSENEIQHHLYCQAQLVKSFTYAKLPGAYHGSGCTLASAISALLALGVDTHSACARALDYTYQTLLTAKQIGKIQYHPNRNQAV